MIATPGPSRRTRRPSSRPLRWSALVMVLALLAGCSGAGDIARPASAPVNEGASGSASDGETDADADAADPTTAVPEGGVLADGRTLVAFYGTAGTPALGVLGEDPPARMHERLERVAQRFARPNRPAQPVYELIVTIADPFPGPRGAFNHDIARADVERYVELAARTGALVVLDLQPGREDFLTVAQRWEWALHEPHVGLALDPEWRMEDDQVPGRVIGSVDAAEVNATTRWLAALQREHDLPEKLLVLHQFRDDMITRPGMIRERPGIAMVQHLDGFGTPGQKLDTFNALARPDKFALGFKLFYDEDADLMSPDTVDKLRPKVRFVSYQ